MGHHAYPKFGHSFWWIFLSLLFFFLTFSLSVQYLYQVSIKYKFIYAQSLLEAALLIIKCLSIFKNLNFEVKTFDSEYFNYPITTHMDNGYMFEQPATCINMFFLSCKGPFLFLDNFTLAFCVVILSSPYSYYNILKDSIESLHHQKFSSLTL